MSERDEAAKVETRAMLRSMMAGIEAVQDEVDALRRIKEEVEVALPAEPTREEKHRLRVRRSEVEDAEGRLRRLRLLYFEVLERALPSLHGAELLVMEPMMGGRWFEHRGCGAELTRQGFGLACPVCGVVWSVEPTGSDAAKENS